MATGPNAKSIALPAGWGVTQLAIHELEPDLSGDTAFSGGVMLQLRLDVEPGRDLEDVASADRKAFENSFPGFKLVSTAEVSAAGKTWPATEYVLEQQGQTIQQLVVYVDKAGDVYSVTATHRSGAPIERVKGVVPGVLESFLGGTST